MTECARSNKRSVPAYQFSRRPRRMKHMRSCALAVVACLLTASSVRTLALRADDDLRLSHVATTPVIVELFTSEGCSDCPSADIVLAKLVAEQPIDGADVIGLGEHVDYWDQLGWKDRFSSAALTKRQQAYGAQFHLGSVYTRQMVVDGRAQFVGSDGVAARKAIERAVAVSHASLTIRIDSTSARAAAATVTVADVPRLGRGDHADIYIAVTEDRITTDV